MQVCKVTAFLLRVALNQNNFFKVMSRYENVPIQTSIKDDMQFNECRCDGDRDGDGIGWDGFGSVDGGCTPCRHNI